MNGLALCSGIGGLDLGLMLGIGERYRTVCHVERDAYAAAVLVARMEEQALDCAPIWDDVTTFRGEPWRGVVDIVSAGFPCQPWSVAGKRKGTEDDRWIWPAIVRIIRECGAPLVFLENVPGLLRHGLREVLSDLAEIGFDAEWTCVSAADVGAPHRRERLFILAYRSGGGFKAKRLAELLRPARVGDAHERSEALAHGDEHGREVLRGLGLLDGERAARGDHADGCDEGLAEPEHVGSVVADAIGGRRDGGAPNARRRPLGRSVTERPGGELEHPERPRLEGRGHPGPQRFAFPPGPGDAEGWERWLAAGGPAPAEPGLRRGIDGPSSRMDRLRCLGNGVVPQQAALAFRMLSERVNA